MAKLIRGETLGTVFPKDEVVAFIVRCMERAGCKFSHARALADTLAEGDYRGHFSHGLNRLEMYVRDVQSGITAVDQEPRLEKETPATAFVDGLNCLGPVVGNFCMKIAIEKAKSVGIAMVVARGSNHYGIAGWYAEMALKEGLIGMSATNTSPFLVPTRARKPALGTNPIAFFAPGEGDDSFELDMASTAVALGKVEMAGRKQEKIPEGWGLDERGESTVEPSDVVLGGGLCPLGGVELTGGYKGYGLAMMVEILCGILAGSAFGPNVRSWKTTSTSANLGQCFMAIDPNAFAGGFEERLTTLKNQIKGSEKASDETEILVAGDPEKHHKRLCDEAGGIRYHPSLVHSMEELAKQMGVQPLMPLEGNN